MNEHLKGQTGDQVAKTTIIVSPRERFGLARESLESLYAETEGPFELVYIDAGTPKELRSWLEEKEREYGFKRLTFDGMLTPNRARNEGIKAATTDYVVMVDNDVIFQRGWLKALENCADETAAEVVTPLTCEGPELHTKIHQAGGKYAEDREAFFSAKPGERVVVDLMHHQGARVDELPPFERTETDACEFHCVLARRDVFDRIGPLDEKMTATKEHLDFCMSVHQVGGKVMFEPSSVVTYLFPTRHHALSPADYPFFMVRWSNHWQRESLDHFRTKWGIAEDEYFTNRYGNLGWRRREGVVKALVNKNPMIRKNRTVVRAMTRALDPFAYLITSYLVGKQAKFERTQQG
jgi:GT2 family glycosyltransferase